LGSIYIRNTMGEFMVENEKPVILITGASGNIGTSLSHCLKDRFTILGLDVVASDIADENYKCDLTSQDSVDLQLHKIREKFGTDIAAVIHLAAYFDFSGEESPLYQTVNVEGTKHLLKALQTFNVERFIYSGTMLVHKAGVPGQKITEKTPIQPGWAYPESKANAEKALIETHGNIPYTILRLAGLYNEHTAVPTLAEQIARIYEKDFKSHLYAGDLSAGQAFIHQDDMLDLFLKVIEKRNDLPHENIILAGEEAVLGYQALQNRIGDLIYGQHEWNTLSLPEFAAKMGASIEEKMEPVIPDDIDKGEKPFIRSFMIDLASDHYDLDISRAKDQLGWVPEHDIHKGLETLIGNLKKDPASWYKANGITAPDWVIGAEEKHVNPDEIRQKHQTQAAKEHAGSIWAHFMNLGLALWLISSPFILSYESMGMIWSDVISGCALLVFAFLSLSRKFGMARWACGLIGIWVLGAPLVFWAPTAAAYLNGTIIGMLIIGFSVLVRPFPGISPVAAQTGPTIPPGWQFCPSSWFQRLPIIILAFIGFFISRYLCAYQLGHIEGVWEPFFTGSAGDPQNGTEEIITSSVSEAWPVPDAGLGAMTYALEILTGLIGSSRRWRTMPWLVMLFGIMIVPLGAVSIFFIIIQPIMLGTWCTLCLIAAAAMLIQIPYSLDELVATSAFLWRRKKKGRPLIKIFFTGDTDEGQWENEEDNFAQPPFAIVKEMLTGGITLPWSLLLCIAIGIWLMFTRLTLDASGGMADADHLIGAIAVTVVITALAESGRSLRFFLIPLGAALLFTPFIYGVGLAHMVSSLICGLALIGLSFPKGKILNTYGEWDKCIV